MRWSSAVSSNAVASERQVAEAPLVDHERCGAGRCVVGDARIHLGHLSCFEDHRDGLTVAEDPPELLGG